MSDAKVLTFTAQGRERTRFDGTEDDARDYIRNNFPRLHVEPGSGDDPVPDAVLDVGGVRTYWDGADWVDWVPPGTTVGGPTAPDDRDTTIADQEAELTRLRAQLAERNGEPTAVPTGSRAAAPGDALPVADSADVVPADPEPTPDEPA